jgi:hypothetical protein
MASDVGSKQMARGEIAQEGRPQYEADEGPLTVAQLDQVRGCMPQSLIRSVRSSLFDVAKLGSRTLAQSHWFGKGAGGGVRSANQDGAPEQMAEGSHCPARGDDRTGRRALHPRPRLCTRPCHTDPDWHPGYESTRSTYWMLMFLISLNFTAKVSPGIGVRNSGSAVPAKSGTTPRNAEASTSASGALVFSSNEK